MVSSKSSFISSILSIRQRGETIKKRRKMEIKQANPLSLPNVHRRKKERKKEINALTFLFIICLREENRSQDRSCIRKMEKVERVACAFSTIIPSKSTLCRKNNWVDRLRFGFDSFFWNGKSRRKIRRC